MGTDHELAAVRRLSAAVLAVSRNLDMAEALQTIVTTARELLGAEYAALGVPDGAGSFAQFVVDGVSDEQWDKIGPLPRQHGMLAVMLQDPNPQRLPDVAADPRFRWWPEAHPRMRAFLGMPIMDGDDILGAIFLANKDGGFTRSDEELLSLLADHAAIALTHARLHDRSRELTIAEERGRIAHDLHDAVAQKLFALRLTARTAATLVDSDPERARGSLDEVIGLAQEAAIELRDAVAELRPASLDEDGLATTLRKEVDVLDRACRAHEGPRVTFEDDSAPVLPPAQQEVLMRIAQEALHNAVRHAKASAILVRLTGGPDGAVLDVVDDGTGFDHDEAARAGRSLGLRSMHWRARSVRGCVTVSSGDGGTAIHVEVPCGRPA